MRTLLVTLLLPLVGFAATGAKSFDDQIAAYKAAGEPIEPKDFDSRGTPPADNAAPALRDAVAAMKPEDDPTWGAYEKLGDIAYPPSDAQIAILRAMVTASSGALQHIDVAMTRPTVDWDIKFNSPVMLTLLPHLDQQRRLAQFVAAHALLAHKDGNDAEAVKDVQRLIFISRAVDHQPFIVTHLVSLACMRMAARTVALIAPDLKVGQAPAASPQEVQQAIAALLDDARPTKSFHDALLAERMSIVDITRCVVEGKINGMNLAMIDPPAPPLGEQSAQRMQADGLLALQFSTAVLGVFDATSDLPSFKAQIPKRPPVLDAKPKEHPIARRLINPNDRSMAMHYRSTADRRLAAVALAVRAYAMAHGGAMPKKLEELVPQYLPSVPADPMSAGQPLTYIAEKSIVYSAGEDGVDDGGSEEPAAGAKQSPPGRWQQRDAVMHLDRQPRPAPQP